MSQFVLPPAALREVDRRAVEDYGLTSLVLMENAGRGCVDLLEGERLSGRILVCCGKGNNAGDGFVIARHLELRGHDVEILLTVPQQDLSHDAAANAAVAHRAGIRRQFLHTLTADQLAETLAGCAWVVDALLGTGAKGEPRAPYDGVIDAINAGTGRVLAVDVPSGLDCETGKPARCTVRAAVTCSFVAAKPGFFQPSAAPYLGRIAILDIGVPSRLLHEVAVAYGVAQSEP